MIRTFIVLSLIFLTSCSNVAGGLMVLAVSSQSARLERQGYKLGAGDKCLFPSKPNPFITGEKISFGEPLTAQYEKLMYVAKNTKHGEPVPPHHLAYIFYEIADRMGDNRAQMRKKWLEPYMKDLTTKEAEKLVNDKFLNTYLNKCFTVPQQYLRKSAELHERLTGSIK